MNTLKILFFVLVIIFIILIININRNIPESFRLKIQLKEDPTKSHIIKFNMEHINFEQGSIKGTYNKYFNEIVTNGPMKILERLKKIAYTANNRERSAYYIYQFVKNDRSIFGDVNTLLATILEISKKFHPSNQKYIYDTDDNYISQINRLLKRIYYAGGGGGGAAAAAGEGALLKSALTNITQNAQPHYLLDIQNLEAHKARTNQQIIKFKDNIIDLEYNKKKPPTTFKEKYMHSLFLTKHQNTQHLGIKSLWKAIKKHQDKWNSSYIIATGDKYGNMQNDNNNNIEITQVCDTKTCKKIGGASSVDIYNISSSDLKPPAA